MDDKKTKFNLITTLIVLIGTFVLGYVLGSSIGYYRYYDHLWDHIRLGGHDRMEERMKYVERNQTDFEKRLDELEK